MILFFTRASVRHLSGFPCPLQLLLDQGHHVLGLVDHRLELTDLTLELGKLVHQVFEAQPSSNLPSDPGPLEPQTRGHPLQDGLHPPDPQGNVLPQSESLPYNY